MQRCPYTVRILLVVMQKTMRYSCDVERNSNCKYVDNHYHKRVTAMVMYVLNLSSVPHTSYFYGTCISLFPSRIRDQQLAFGDHL